MPLVISGCTSTAGRTATGTASAAPSGHRGLSAVRHVWVIELENQGYARSFGTPAADPYLAKTLPRMGALLENYYAIGHASADNYIAQVSGQAPTLATQADCPFWTPFPGPVVAGPYHQVLGEGCVYPAAVPTLGNQLSAAGRSWAAYLQDMGNDPGRDHTVSTARGPACGYPATGSIDRTGRAERGDQYAARHDGFTFFRSITANPAFCAAHILSFRPLPRDLARAGATPAFSFLAPDLCNDGHDAPCADGAAGGLAQADRFLAHWVPVIMAAPAYQDGGLIVITFDEGSDAAACCGESSGLGPSHFRDDDPHLARRIAGVGPHGVHRIAEVDFAGHVHLDAAMVATGGVVCSYSTSDDHPAIPYWTLGFKDTTLRLLGSDDFPALVKADAARTLTEALLDGSLRSHIAARYRLDQIADAHAAVEAGADGRVVIEVTENPQGGE